MPAKKSARPQDAKPVEVKTAGKTKVREVRDLRQPLLALLLDPNFTRLEAHDRAFNPLRVLGVEHYEIRHVNTLAWLLDPTQSHGLGNAFFKLFMQVLWEKEPDTESFCRVAASMESPMHVRREVTEDGLRKLQRAEIDAAVAGVLDRVQEIPDGGAVGQAKRRGPRRLDLLMSGQGWVLGLEAKIAARLHGKQLKVYREALRAGAQDSRCLLVFLNCDADDGPDDEGWVHLTWQRAVVEPLRTLLEGPLKHRRTNPEFAFLSGYLDVLEEQCQMDGSPRELLLAQLVATHEPVISELSGRREANLPEDVNELIRQNSALINALTKRYQSPARRRAAALKAVLANTAGLTVLSQSSNSTIRFLPTEWLSVPWIHEPGRAYPRVVCELFNRSDLGIRFKLMICDLDPAKFAGDVHFARRQHLRGLVQASQAERAVFPQAFRANGDPARPDGQYWGIKLTDWLNTGLDNPLLVQAELARFMTSVNRLTELIGQIAVNPATPTQP